MRIAILTFSLLLSFFLYAQSEGPRPKWVELSERVKPSTILKESGIQFLNFDHQVNASTASDYYRYTLLLETPEAVNNYGNLQISFDPSFQELTVHRIVVIRKGKEIDLLQTHDANLIRAESNRNRLIYDSTLTLVYHLEDIRVGDILEYEFTKSGSNPAFQDHFYTSEYLQWYQPVGHLNYRVIVPKGFQYSLLYDGNEIFEPKETISGNEQVLHWERRNVKAADFEEDEPDSYDPRPRVALSDFQSWLELSNEAAMLYDVQDSKSPLIKKQVEDLIQDKQDLNEKTLAIVRFVQNEIRYLGFEAGVHAFKPHSPEQVLTQRFGDCKDKSLLLVEMLKQIGLEANPMWVNTSKGGRLKPDEVSPYVFNHCVATFMFKDERLYVDPTISNQGGTIRRLNFPNYKQGLIIGAKSESLHQIPLQKTGRMEVTDRFVVPQSSLERTRLRVETTYRGFEADYIRSYLKSNSMSVVTEEYLNYYKNYYPGIKSIGEVIFTDDLEYNIIEVLEEYEIDSLWKDTENVQQQAFFYMPLIRGLLSINDDLDRKSPYALAYPKHVVYKAIINLPEPWPIKNQQYDLTRSEYAYRYELKTNSAKDEIRVAHEYYVSDQEVFPEDYNRMVKDHDEFLSNVGYTISRVSDRLGEKNPGHEKKRNLSSSLLIVLRVLSFVIGVILFLRVNRVYDPKLTPDSSKAVATPIGGWLILPLIGLIVAPFIRLYQTINAYSDSDLDNLVFIFDPSSEAFNPFFASVVILEELVGMLLIAFILLLIYQFFKQRSSLPRLLIILYAVNLVWIILRAILVDISANIDFLESSGDILRALVSAGIWIPYFAFSDRVKETFVVSRAAPISESNQTEG